MACSINTKQEGLEIQAQELVLQVSQNCTSQYKGTWTLSTYDTAWVSMIQRKDGSWLFPESFNYIILQQIPGSGWKSNAPDINSILNTMAALLAIEKHLAAEENMPIQCQNDLTRRKSQGITYLREALGDWDVRACILVGFEIIIPALLRMLESYGIELEFPGRQILLEINALKMKRFDPNILYGPAQTTALHSLEAFTDAIDFRKVAHHKVGGSMMGSPSATAAYLMHHPEWDQEAEEYLRACIQHGGGFGLGGVPCAYPCGIFEFSWVLTTLIEAGFSASMFRNENVHAALDAISVELASNQGKIGFARGLLPDADDTAKTILLLNLLGRHTSAEPLTSYFLSPKGHILTYLHERHLSPSANCNALMCILSMPENICLLPAVESIINALCDYWCEDSMVDKWNLSPNYTFMLLAQAFSKVVMFWESGSLQTLPESLIRDRVVMVLSQILKRALFEHNSSGSNEERPYTEPTAYRILACTALRSLPFPRSLLSQLDIVIQTGKDWLRISTIEKDQYLWIGKMTYGSQTLSQAYHIAAMYASVRPVKWSSAITLYFQPSEEFSPKM